MIHGLRVLRVCYGPLPLFLCNITGFLNGCAILFAAIIVVMNTLTRFMFVCIWKRMKQMDDNLIVGIATIQAIFMSLFFNGASWLQLKHQLTIPVSFFLLFLHSWLRPNPKNTYMIKFSSGLYWNCATCRIFQTTFVNISIHLIFLHFHYNWFNDCNTNKMSH